MDLKTVIAELHSLGYVSVYDTSDYALGSPYYKKLIGSGSVRISVCNRYSIKYDEGNEEDGGGFYYWVHDINNWGWRKIPDQSLTLADIILLYGN